jgi:hypothetical protein
MILPTKMKEMLDAEGPHFRRLFSATYNRVEKLGLVFHEQDSPNVIATHPKNGINFLALWLRGRRGERRIEADIRVDGFQIEDITAQMHDTLVLHKYDRGEEKPLWLLVPVHSLREVNKVCGIGRRLMVKDPMWWRRMQ